MKEREKAERSREELRRRLTNSQEEERRRIARELHDQMGQNLTALSFGLRSLNQGESSRDDFSLRVQQLQELAAQTARDLHRVALELRPSALDDLGLVKALDSLLEMWARHCHIESDFESSNYDPAGVSSEIETTLYRVIQEALNNVAKHSGASHVSVLLSRTPKNVEAIIEDDGRGFDVAQKLQAPEGRSRLGVVGMKERLSGIGGQLQVESSPNNGTTLIIRIPLR
jgi:signal transduction histidine kinase